MFKPVQLSFLLDEFIIYFNKLLVNNLPCFNRPFVSPSQFGVDTNYHGYTKFMNKLRQEIWDAFAKQNENNLQQTFYNELLDLKYLSELIDLSPVENKIYLIDSQSNNDFIRTINLHDRLLKQLKKYLPLENNEVHFIDAQFYNDFTNTINLYDNLLIQWQNQTNRSTKDNYEAMIILLKQEESLSYPYGYQEIKNPEIKANFSDKVKEDNICTTVYDINNLGGLFYLLFLLSSQHPTLKKCYICNSYYTESELRMYCSDKCKERDIYTKQYNKIMNRLNKNLIKNEQNIDKLDELHNSWKRREIDNATFKNSMDALELKN